MTPELQLLLAIVLLFIVVIIGYKAEKRDNKRLCGLCINATIVLLLLVIYLITKLWKKR